MTHRDKKAPSCPESRTTATLYFNFKQFFQLFGFYDPIKGKKKGGEAISGSTPKAKLI